MYVRASIYIYIQSPRSSRRIGEMIPGISPRRSDKTSRSALDPLQQPAAKHRSATKPHAALSDHQIRVFTQRIPPSLVGFPRHLPPTAPLRLFRVTSSSFLLPVTPPGWSLCNLYMSPSAVGASSSSFSSSSSSTVRPPEVAVQLPPLFLPTPDQQGRIYGIR